jgi:hypothetical protein
MKTESTILPFVFVDGRKYVLAETEALPEPEIFGKLTPPPRKVSSQVHWRLYFRHEMELLCIAVFIGLCSSVGMLFAFGGDAGVFATMMTVMCLPALPIIVQSASRIYLGRYETANILQLLQDGFAGKGRFTGLCATGKKIDNAAEMQLKYQFTTQEGNTYNAAFCMANVKKIMALSDESLKLIFYDPAQPRRNMLFDTLPKGIEFDDESAAFRTKSSFLITQILWLCFGAAIFPVIFLVVIVFLC